MKVLKVGLLVNSRFSNKYDYDLALWARDQANIKISHLIVYPRHRDSNPGRVADIFLTQGPYALLSKLLFRLIVSVEKLFLKRSSLHGDHYQIFDLGKLVDEVLTISPIISKSGFVYRFSTEDIEKMRALDFDLLIRCGAGILRGDVLHASRLGIVSFHHGDNRINRGGPAGFWECYYKWPQTGFIIQRLTEELDAGDVLVRGSFATRYFYSLNQAHIYEKSNAHLKSLLSRIASTRKLPPAENTPNPYSNILFRAPNAIQTVVYGFKLLTRMSIKVTARILMIRKRWGISLLSSTWDKAVFWRSTEVKPTRGRFWADPFLYSYEGRTFCFVEDFIYKTGRAHITALEIIGTKPIELGTALKQPFHLSFPFLFRYQEALYMCPEARASGQIRIYRCAEFPLKWELQTVIMENVRAADTMLFERRGKWWMLTNLDESGAEDHCSELYLFSSDSPLGTNWTPHPQNPVRIDAHGGAKKSLNISAQNSIRIAPPPDYQPDRSRATLCSTLNNSR